MGNKHKVHRVFETVTREVAVQKWAGWWCKYIDDHYNGKMTHAALAIFGAAKNGQPRSQSQANKWRYAENNALPSGMLIELILADAELKFGRAVDPMEMIEHDLPFMQVNDNKVGPRRGSSTMGKRNDAVFTIDDENVPTPDMSFKGSADHPGYYEFKLDAILPMAGVLAIMALIDDAR